MHYHPDFDAGTIAEEHRRWNRQHAEPLERLSSATPCQRSRSRPPASHRICLAGFQAACGGPDGAAAAGEPRSEEFEVFCYAEVQKPDADDRAFSRRMPTNGASTVGLSDEQMADMIRQDKIDILVDLAGHTAGGRLLVFARKPAPVQVTRQGYPNTTGLTTIDYRMTDAHADPPGLSDTLHSEQIDPPAADQLDLPAAGEWPAAGSPPRPAGRSRSAVSTTSPRSPSRCLCSGAKY